MSDSHPKCHACHYCEYKQCTRQWWDNNHGHTARVKRQIVVVATAHEEFPAHHVYQFFCQGTGFKPNGLGEKK